jgi:hypothetical protein
MIFPLTPRPLSLGNREGGRRPGEGVVIAVCKSQINVFALIATGRAAPAFEYPTRQPNDQRKKILPLADADRRALSELGGNH